MATLKEQVAELVKAKRYGDAIRVLEKSSDKGAAATIVKLKQRMAEEHQQGVMAQIDRAKLLITEQKWDAARAVLVTIDDPAADMLLDRLEKIKPVEGKVKNAPVVYVQPDKSFTGKLVVAVVLLFVLFFPGLIALWVFAGEAKRYPDAPGAQGLIWLNRIVFTLFAMSAALLICSIVAINLVPPVRY
jgi:hypothetical protein